MNIFKGEPVMVQVGIQTTIQAIMQLIPLFGGPQLSPDLTSAITIIAVAISGFFARARVAPMASLPVAVQDKLQDQAKS